MDPMTDVTTILSWVRSQGATRWQAILAALDLALWAARQVPLTGMNLSAGRPAFAALSVDALANRLEECFSEGADKADKGVALHLALEFTRQLAA